MATFKMNEQGVRDLYKEIAKKVEKEDQAIRRSAQGKTASQVKSLAKRRFASIGLNLTDKNLTDYAKSVVERKDFNFTLT